MAENDRIPGVSAAWAMLPAGENDFHSRNPFDLRTRAGKAWRAEKLAMRAAALDAIGSWLHTFRSPTYEEVERDLAFERIKVSASRFEIEALRAYVITEVADLCRDAARELEILRAARARVARGWTRHSAARDHPNRSAAEVVEAFDALIEEVSRG